MKYLVSECVFDLVIFALGLPNKVIEVFFLFVSDFAYLGFVSVTSFIKFLGLLGVGGKSKK
jgi:hypothetical protein